MSATWIFIKPLSGPAILMKVTLGGNGRDGEESGPAAFENAAWITAVACPFQYDTFDRKGSRMFRAMVEVLGAFFANAPVSEDARGRQFRFLAVAMTLAAVFICVGIAIHR
jgi:hypothetical protein